MPLGKHQCNQHIGHHNKQYQHWEQLEKQEDCARKPKTNISIDNVLQLGLLAEPEETAQEKEGYQ